MDGIGNISMETAGALMAARSRLPSKPWPKANRWTAVRALARARGGALLSAHADIYRPYLLRLRWRGYLCGYIERGVSHADTSQRGR